MQKTLFSGKGDIKKRKLSFIWFKKGDLATQLHPPLRLFLF